MEEKRENEALESHPPSPEATEASDKKPQSRFWLGLFTGFLFTAIAAFIIANASAQKMVEEVETSKQHTIDWTMTKWGETKSILANLQTEYDAYKEKMKPFEELDAAKAEQELATMKAEEEAKKAAEEQAAAEAKAAEEAKKAEEEAKGYETGLTYENIAREPDTYKGQKLQFTGKIIQVIRGYVTNTYRIAIDSDYNKIIYCEYRDTATKFLDGDIVFLKGKAAGEETYKSTIGGQITIPKVTIDSMELSQ